MTFSTLHIAFTSLITAVFASGLAYWSLKSGRRGTESVIIGVLCGIAVFLWRQSANMPQLNDDGLEGFSANDWLAPVITYVFLACYESFRTSEPSDRFPIARTLATISALVVNVVTI